MQVLVSTLKMLVSERISQAMHEAEVNIPTKGAQSSLSSTRETFTVGAPSTPTFLLDFFEPSLSLLRFKFESDIM